MHALGIANQYPSSNRHTAIHIHISPPKHLLLWAVTLPPMKTKNFVWLLLLLALLVGVGVGVGGMMWVNALLDQSTTKSIKEITPISVISQQVEAVTWHDSVQAIGTVQARESVNITAKVSDIVEHVHFASGQQVAAGTLLVTLRSEAQQAALAQAQATFAEAQRLYQRQLELADQQLVARSTLDTQQALRDSAQARVQQLRAERDERQVHAPFAGVLGIRQISPGALLTANTVITTLDDLDQVYVDFQLPESMLAKLAIGNEVRASSVAWPDREFSGQVSVIDTRINANSRAITVRAEFANQDHALRPGMLLDVALLEPERTAIVVPEIAVIQEGQQSFVYVVVKSYRIDNRYGAREANQVKVKTGARHKGQVEIVEGLAVDQHIVIEGMHRLRPGSFVSAADIKRKQACEADPTCEFVQLN